MVFIVNAREPFFSHDFLKVRKTLRKFERFCFWASRGVIPAKIFLDKCSELFGKYKHHLSVFNIVVPSLFDFITYYQGHAATSEFTYIGPRCSVFFLLLGIAIRIFFGDLLISCHYLRSVFIILVLLADVFLAIFPPLFGLFCTVERQSRLLVIHL